MMAWELRTKTHYLIDKTLATRLVQNIRRGEWFFLCQVGGNLDPYIFAQLCTELDKSLTHRNTFAQEGGMANGGVPGASLYPSIASATAAEKEAEAAASAAAAVESAIEAAAERIELQEVNESKKE